MRYFVGYLLTGDVAAWHSRLARDISEKFGTWEIYKKYPPHVTVLRPFEVDDLSGINRILEEEVYKKSVPGNIVLEGFDCFNESVIFAKVEVDDAVRDFVVQIKEASRSIPAMPPEDFPVWHPHASLAYHITPEEFQQIWNYLQTQPKPRSVLPFDNLTLFRFTDDQIYVVEKSFYFTK